MRILLVRQSLCCLLLAFILTACGGSGGGSSNKSKGKSSGGSSNNTVTQKIELFPASVLLNSVSASAASLGASSANSVDLAAIISAKDGSELSKELVWSSSKPDTVSVDSNGVITALKPLGSALITATVDGVTSNAVTVLIAEPVPNTTLIDDDQVVSAIVLVDPDSAGGAGTQYTVTLANLDSPPPIGSIVMSTGAAPVGGKVVATEVVADGIKVTLEVVPIKELFAQFEFDEEYDLSNVPLDPAPAIADLYEMVRLPDGSWELTLKEGVDPEVALLPEASPVALQPDPFTSVTASAVGDTFYTVGPFECVASVKTPLRLRLPAKATLINELKYKPQFYSGGDLKQLALTGKLTVSSTFKPRLEASIEGKVDCELELTIVNVPITGPLAWLAAFQIPIGVGTEIKGKLTLAQVGFDVGANISISPELGFFCVQGGPCNFRDELNPDADVDFELVLPFSDDVQVKLDAGLFVYLYAKMGAGVPVLGGAASINFVRGRGGMQLKSDLALKGGQVADPDYASSYGLSLDVAVGLAASGAKGFFDLFSIDIGSSEIRSTLPISYSPKASNVTVDFENYHLFDPVTFRVDMDPEKVRFFGIYNVEDVVIYEVLGSTGVVSLSEVARQSASPGQTSFVIPWKANRSGNSENKFVAFVETTLLPLPIFGSLELGVAKPLDTDGDLMADGWEKLYGLNPFGNDASQDKDGDELSNLDEYKNDTFPQLADSDEDGLPDGWEVKFGFDPRDTNEADEDPDEDGFTNYEEYVRDTNPIIDEGNTNNIYFVGEIEFGEEGNVSILDAIFVLTIDGSVQVSFPANEDTDDDTPVASPDGTRVVFKRDNDGADDLFVISSDGSSIQPLTFTPGDREDDLGWWPDSSRVIYQAEYLSGENIFSSYLDGSGATNLTAAGGASGDIRDSRPNVSPDGSRIVFDRNNSGSYDIFVMSADGTEQTNVTNSDSVDNYATFSPDGTKILFSSNRADGGENFKLYLMDVDGQNVVNLSNNLANHYKPQWSPDGQYIAYERSFQGGAERLYTMNPDGTNQIAVTPAGDFELDGSWRWVRDSSQLVYDCRPDGLGTENDICAVNPDGTEVIRLTSTPSIDESLE